MNYCSNKFGVRLLVTPYFLLIIFDDGSLGVKMDEHLNPLPSFVVM